MIFKGGLLLMMMLSGCGFGSSCGYKTQMSQNADYNGKYGYDTRLYTSTNVELLQKALSTQQLNHTIIKRDVMNKIQEKINESNVQNQKDMYDTISKYLSDYKEMINSTEDSQDDSDRAVSSDYFNLEDYTRQRPIMNVIDMKYFEVNHIMPMTDETMQSFGKYYQQHDQTLEQKSVSNFNENIQERPYKTNEIYSLKASDNLDKVKSDKVEEIPKNDSSKSIYALNNMY